MTVAICLSGQLRNFRHTFPRFKKYILDELNPDVFIFAQKNDDSDIDFVQQNYKPIICELHNGVDDIVKNEIHKWEYHRSLSQQLYNVYRCNEFKKSYEEKIDSKYDLVMRIRPDCFFTRQFTKEELSKSERSVLIPAGWNFSEIVSYSKADIFACSNSSNMDIYSNCYTKINEYATCVPFLPEPMIGFNLLVNNLETEEYPINFMFEYPEELTEIIPTNYNKFNFRDSFLK